jgi:hypothetical protein
MKPSKLIPSWQSTCALFAILNVVGFSLLLCQPRVQKPLDPYVAFLDHHRTTCKEYILSLFEQHDVVIICERMHPEITQYDLFLSIASDPRFIKSVGNIFTEVGVVTQAPRVNEFIHRGHLLPDSVDRMILEFQRNCTFFAIWENYNYSYFLRGLYELNQKLPAGSKLNLFNSDIPFDWSTLDQKQLKEMWDRLPLRDSIMAGNIVRVLDPLQREKEGRHKALVIMNYRHAFGHKFEYPQGTKPNNVGRYLFDRYGDKVANVYLNSVAFTEVRSDNDVTYAPICDGKWDAAFKSLGVRDAGFSFKGSPFGKDAFDIWPRKVSVTYEEVFDGFAYYGALDEQKLVVGMPGLVDSAFAAEVQRRSALYSTLPGGRFAPLTNVEAFTRQMNTKREHKLETLDSLMAKIDKWIQH